MHGVDLRGVRKLCDVLFTVFITGARIMGLTATLTNKRFCLQFNLLTGTSRTRVWVWFLLHIKCVGSLPFQDIMHYEQLMAGVIQHDLMVDNLIYKVL